MKKLWWAHLLPMEKVNQWEFKRLLKKLLERIDQENKKMMHLSMDIDGLDLKIAVETRTAVKQDFYRRL